MGRHREPERLERAGHFRKRKRHSTVAGSLGDVTGDHVKPGAACWWRALKDGLRRTCGQCGAIRYKQSKDSLSEVALVKFSLQEEVAKDRSRNGVFKPFPHHRSSVRRFRCLD